MGNLAPENLPSLGLSEGLAPGLAADEDVGTLAAAHFGDALAKVTGAEDHQFLAGLDEIRNRRFHAGAAGSREHVNERILSSEQDAQVLADLLDDFKKVRIEVTHDGLTHGLVHAWLDLRRARPEQQTPGRMNERHKLEFNAHDIQGA